MNIKQYQYKNNIKINTKEIMKDKLNKFEPKHSNNLNHKMKAKIKRQDNLIIKKIEKKFPRINPFTE